MKILVVGGAGYVGGGIVDKLSQEHEVTVYDSLIYETSYRKKVNFIPVSYTHLTLPTTMWV